MKRFLLLLAGIVSACASLSTAQWVTQHSGLPTGTPTIPVRFAAVNDSVCWGVNTSDNTPGNQFMITTDGGAIWTTWTVLTAPSSWRGSYVAALDADTAWILMHDPSFLTSGGVFKTTDGGNTWGQQTTAFPGSGGNPKIIHFFDANTGICIGNPNPPGDWEIYRTTNGGTLWTRMHLPAQTDEVTFFLHSSSGNSFWFSSGIGGPFDWRLYRTTDQGFTWSTFNHGGSTSFPAFKDSLNGITARSIPPPNELMRTSDGGVTWQSIPISLPFSTRFIRYVPGTSSWFVMTSYACCGLSGTPGSAYTRDDGVNWILIDSTIHRAPAAFASATAGWCGGEFDSVYKWIGFPSSVHRTDEIVRGFRLEQNYPNPFNPATRIKFTLSSQERDGVRSLVTLKVFDVLGREVRTLVNENLQTGSYETTFDARGLASGVYFYRLQTGAFVQTRKLLLLK